MAASLEESWHPDVCKPSSKHLPPQIGSSVDPCDADSLELARKARNDQGNMEAEFSFGGEADLHKHFVKCPKNPGHKQFIPAVDFSIDHLPNVYRNEDIFDCIKSVADLSVRLVVKHTSLARPEIHNGCPYPFSQVKGKQCWRVGTGWVQDVREKFTKSGRWFAGRYTGMTFTEGDIQTCPCLDCINSGNPKKEWASVDVLTATHVVFDTDEVLHTTCELFYDSDEDRAQGRVQTLTGIEVARNNVQRDISHMTFVTHDLDLWDKLEKLCPRRDELLERLHDQYMHPYNQHKLTVIPSHPHGCSKQVSLGEWTVQEPSNQWAGDYSEYSYDTNTCPGSSGAPVFLLGKGWAGWCMHPHSGRCGQNGFNKSGSGIDDYP